MKIVIKKEPGKTDQAAHFAPASGLRCSCECHESHPVLADIDPDDTKAMIKALSQTVQIQRRDLFRTLRELLDLRMEHDRCGARRQAGS